MIRPPKRSMNAGPRIFMKPADTTRSGRYAATASVSAVSQAPRSGKSFSATRKCGTPAASACSVAAHTRSTPTATISAG
ncbi:Uncharacterised protein [Mycobacteroides abscessus subsp. abscessus]|nr:Uncharacterised protein [Mycobacteroides abscessus subsp. abscessus]